MGTKRSLAIALMFLLAGCASKYRVDANEVNSTVVPEGGFYVMIPSDGAYGGTTYQQSGSMLAQEVYSALIGRTKRVVKGDSVEKLNEALDHAKENGIGCVIESTILHWEDRATEWSGRPDRITIRYAAYDANTGRQVAYTVRSASSKWATFGGDHPQDLLPVPTEAFVAMLIGNGKL